MTITREALTIDLRPLVAGGPARVEAVYHLHNAGGGKTLDLVFASGSAAVADFRVSLGGKPVAGTPVPGAELPAQPPKETPGLHDDRG